MLPVLSKNFGKLNAIVSSWLEERIARVCVDGCFSHGTFLRDMVFQGTVLGPLLWNVYYGDSSVAVRATSFIEAVFADDLNCWRIFSGSTSHADITEATKTCQSSLHAWGAANQVVFEPTKESLHILDSRSPLGSGFKILSVHFDLKLSMHEAVYHFSTEAGWRLRTLLRTSRHHTSSVLVRLF